MLNELFLKKIDSIDIEIEGKNNDKAEELCNDLLDDNLKGYELVLVLSKLLTVYSEIDNTQGIIEISTKIIELIRSLRDPFQIEFYELSLFHRAEAYKSINQIQRAINDYNEIITIKKLKKCDTNFIYQILSYQSLGMIQGALSKNKSGDEKEKLLRLARRNYRSALKLDGDNILTYIGLGVTYNDLEEYEKSKTAYEKCMELQIEQFGKKDDVDKILYKYKPINKYTINSLKNENIFFNNPQKFNDPYDCIVYRMSNYLENKSFQFAIDKVRILSLTNKRDSILMWSHYANAHKGICIGYRIDAKYLKELNICFDEIEYRDVFDKNKNNFKNILYESYFIKNKVWKYENEYRLMTYTDEYVLKSPIIVEIIFGLLISDKDKRKIIRIFKGDDIRFYQVTDNKENMMNLKIVKIEKE